MTLPGSQNDLSAIGWDPVFPPPLILLLWLGLAALAVGVTWRPGRRISAGRRATVVALRLAALALLMLPLLQPFLEETLSRKLPDRGILTGLDISRSMAETDTPDGASRLDAARALIRKHHLAGPGPLGTGELSAFAAESLPMPPGNLDGLAATGDTTRLGDSINGILRDCYPGRHYAGLILFTDGHDFQGTPPESIGKHARRLRIPIFPVPMGNNLELPDVAVSMISTQPMTFVRQKARLEAEVRFRSMGSRRFRVELLRDGQPLRRQEITSNGDGTVPVAFEVTEDQPGQYEYEIRCAGPADERVLENNSVLTYLNVSDARIPVLLVEGQPHWDTGFLQRTLSRNDRISLDSITAMGSSRRHTARSDPAQPPLPDLTPDRITGYPVIILGRNVERVLDPAGVAAVAAAVNGNGATLVLARGKPGTSKEWEDLAPAEPASGFNGPVNFAITEARGDVVPVEIFEGYGEGRMPALPAAAAVGAPKSLASVEARIVSGQGGAVLPGMLLRRQGAGQVFEVTVDGLWKWSLNSKASGDDNIFDRFWNQLLLNLVTRSSRAASDQPQLVISRANMTVGEEARFQLLVPEKDGKPVLEFTQVPQLSIQRDGMETGTVTMEPSGLKDGRAGSMVVTQPGRFHAKLSLPSGGTLECRFGVQSLATETTAVSTDIGFLKKLAESSGGRMLNPDDLAGLTESLVRAATAESAAPPETRRRSLWNTGQCFLALSLLFGLDWFLRRRWGFV